MALRLAHAGKEDMVWLQETQWWLYEQEFGYGPVFAQHLQASFDMHHQHADTRDHVWIATQGDERLGAIAMLHDPDRPGWGKLRWFLVLAAARGQGLGSRLMDVAMEHAQATFEGVSLWTCSDLDAARRQYERHGFTLAGEASCPWKDGIVQQRFERRF